MEALILTVFFLLYFAPCIVAVMREHKNAVPIAVLNFLLGWTFIGWAGALVWSLTSKE